MDQLVDWQNNYQNIRDRGQHLLDTEKWADCRFLVGTPPNQKLLPGHKLILAMASPVFERMFYGNLPDKTDPIVIPDVQPEAFHAMLEYIYSDKINISSFDKACELCYVAKKYLLPHVVAQCTHFLWADLSPKNACRAYEFAKLFDEPRLMQSSMEIISAKTKEVLADPNFCDIEMSTFLTILDCDKLNIDTELDLFNALLRYAMERGCMPDDNDNVLPSTSSKCTENQPESVTIDEEHPVVDVESMHETIEPFDVDEQKPDPSLEQLRQRQEEQQNIDMDAQRKITDQTLMRQAVKKIRFLTMTPQQFAEGPARSKLLQQNEALSILIKISSPCINDCPMPEGFCTSRISRKANFPQPSSHDNYDDFRMSAADRKKPLLFPSMSNSVYELTPPIVTNRFSDTDNLTNDTRRSYCVRTIQQQFDYRNTSVTDCGLNFQVDTNIMITGVQVPTQVLCGELMNSAGFSERYTEILYAHVQDMQGSRLTYTHCTSRVRYDSMLEISFDRPVYIYRNRIYKIYVVFNKIGWYPMYTCVPDIICNRVKFMFNVGAPTESVRDGLIRAIVFLHTDNQSPSPDRSTVMLD